MAQWRVAWPLPAPESPSWGAGRKKRRSAADAIRALGGEAIPLPADVLDRAQLESAREALAQEWGRLDILVNAAGGNTATATVMGDLTFFDMTQTAFDHVLELNLTGTVLPTQVFGPLLVEDGQGVIVNISSMAAQRPLTRVVGVCRC